jgi:hypothetical protein
VQPLFYFLAEQIDLAGQQAEEEPALRIAYCDVNESCCSPAAVYGLIAALKQQYGSKEGGGRQSSSGQSSRRQSSSGQNRSESTAVHSCGDLWEALQQVGVGYVLAVAEGVGSCVLHDKLVLLSHMHAQATSLQLAAAQLAQMQFSCLPKQGLTEATPMSSRPDAAR